jgi:hypothetical protein
LVELWSTPYILHMRNFTNYGYRHKKVDLTSWEQNEIWPSIWPSKLICHPTATLVHL